VKDFKKLLIWQKGMDTVIEVYKAVSAFPAEEKFGLKSQVTRSAVSIPANIAEGSAKTSEKEYKYFLEIAMGSAFELETHFLIVQRLGWLKNEIIDGLLRMIAEVQKMLAAFIMKLKPKA
jgi:four helix bundle protein